MPLHHPAGLEAGVAVGTGEVLLGGVTEHHVLTEVAFRVERPRADLRQRRVGRQRYCHSVSKFATLGGKQHLTLINFSLSLPIPGVNIPLSNEKQGILTQSNELNHKIEET